MEVICRRRRPLLTHKQAIKDFLAAERALAQAEAERRAQEERAQRLRREHEERLAAYGHTLLPEQTEEPKWGTPAAKRREIERLRAKIAANRKG